jgi:hypothetical protein
LQGQPPYAAFRSEKAVFVRFARRSDPFYFSIGYLIAGAIYRAWHKGTP